MHYSLKWNLLLTLLVQLGRIFKSSQIKRVYYGWTKSKLSPPDFFRRRSARQYPGNFLQNPSEWSKHFWMRGKFREVYKKKFSVVLRNVRKSKKKVSSKFSSKKQIRENQFKIPTNLEFFFFCKIPVSGCYRYSDPSKCQKFRPARINRGNLVGSS